MGHPADSMQPSSETNVIFNVTGTTTAIADHSFVMATGSFDPLNICIPSVGSAIQLSTRYHDINNNVLRLDLEDIGYLRAAPSASFSSTPKKRTSTSSTGGNESVHVDNPSITSTSIPVPSFLAQPSLQPPETPNLPTNSITPPENVFDFVNVFPSSLPPPPLECDQSITDDVPESSKSHKRAKKM
ncbi:uncharacterized protein EI90DRAFT_3020799 [Cantharellus anzutake]|uniref:uncharacterized protein n=1 Tax=Cantharellus anzutake TaxID=1750568 RepID=UPI001905D015|nr:uncharacterized protein EI90DRAFT_3020799 [Cantharellus anzutake]KAF8319507.1 hypothetical protein EI90DRAFT_3020799 [Cantharellus anzutake]